MRSFFRSCDVENRQLAKPQFEKSLAKWKGLEPEIEYLIIATEDYIVFLDKDLDVDWQTTDETDRQQLSAAEDNAKELSRSDDPKSEAPESDKYKDPTDKPEFNGALNRVAELETTPSDQIARTMKMHFKRLIGEGLSRALAGDYKGADEIFDAASSYILARSQETSRYWYLSASALATLLFVVIGLFLWIARTSVQAALRMTFFWLVLSGCAGALGALVSVIGRTGKQQFDSSAGRCLHYLEASSRICAGAISGILVGLAVRAGLLLTAVVHNGNLAPVVILAALASGASERFATSIIADLGASRVALAKESES
jgi:hypothetical protein